MAERKSQKPHFSANVLPAVVITALRAFSIPAQSQAAPSESLVFEVASVKPAARLSGYNCQLPGGETYSIEGAPVASL